MVQPGLAGSEKMIAQVVKSERGYHIEVIYLKVSVKGIVRGGIGRIATYPDGKVDYAYQPVGHRMTEEEKVIENASAVDYLKFLHQNAR